MKTELFRNRLLVDGYGSPQSIVESHSVMQKLLQEVNEIVFGGRGIIRIIPVFEEANPRNNGLSGIILAPGGHFTCHTFSHRGVFFIDVVAMQVLNRDALLHIISKRLKPSRIVLCERDLGSGFGRHVILRIPSQDFVIANALIDKIVAAIQMTPLCTRMSIMQPEKCDVLQPITESHIGFHDGILDVFSCKDFSVDSLISALDSFDIRPSKMLTVSRGFDMDDKIL